MMRKQELSLVLITLAWGFLSSAWTMVSLPWSFVQIGWIAGPLIVLCFALATFYTTHLLFKSESVSYLDAVRVHLGDSRVKFYKFFIYFNRFGAAISSTISGSTCIMAIIRCNCLHRSGGDDPCHIKGIIYMISFGILEIFLSQIPELDKQWWFSVFAAVMSFSYSTIGLGLGVSKIIENRGDIQGSWTGIDVLPNQKFWRVFAAVGNIAFGYSYFQILIEIQEKMKSPPPQSKSVKTAMLISVAVTTMYYLACGSLVYAALGENSPGNPLMDFDFGFRNPFWLLDVANGAILLHLAGVYQTYSQPIFSAVEQTAARLFPHSSFVNAEVKISIPMMSPPLRINGFRLVSRTAFVVVTTLFSTIFPFFTDVGGLIGALVFWPLNMYFPLEIYIAEDKIHKWCRKWIFLKMLSTLFLLVSIGAAVACFAAVITDLMVYKPFSFSI
ncbi:amino acid permease 3-like [Vicia villosa]|uniref:amino acid permease 3-like n=1 Tax=Vicia villosa TaxID=3911 RepID=UPI00273AFE63|nr:amino acid permease 3-like [Vicia villosa]